MKIAVASLLPDTGHMTNLLRVAQLLQANGFQCHFFGPIENIELAEQRNIGHTCFEVARPSNHLRKRAVLSKASRFWQDAIYNRWFYVNFFEKAIYCGLQQEQTLSTLIASYSPDAILCDALQFQPVYEKIAQTLHIPVIINFAPGTYHFFQSRNHETDRPHGAMAAAALPLVSKLLGTLYSVSNRIFFPAKFKNDEQIHNTLTSYWSTYEEDRLPSAARLKISAGTGILERKWLADSITIPDDVVQTGPIAYSAQNALSDDLRNWLNAPGAKPVVYVSLGTMVKGRFAFFADVIGAARELGYRVLWAYGERPWDESEDSDDLRWETWLPQLDVLSHPRVELFISHGGAGAIQEALWFSKPIVSIPFLWDHFYNAWVVEKLCHQTALNKDRLSRRLLLEQMKAAAGNRENFERVGAEFRALEGSKELCNAVQSLLNTHANWKAESNLDRIQLDRSE